MTHLRPYDLKKFLTVIGLVPVLAGIWIGLVLTAGPAATEAAASALAMAPAQSTDLEVVKMAQSDADPVNGDIIYNGDRITYTVSIRNLTGGLIHINSVTDNLPAGVLFNVQCLQGANCQVSNDTVTWQNFDVNSGSTTLLKFSAVVGCLASGAQISNQVGVSYGSSYLPSNFKVSTAQLKPLVLNAAGRPLLDGPSGCSAEVKGHDQDWGDFDQDGDLDLALATETEVAVYRNDNGQLNRFNGDSHRTFGVRWADLDGDGQLELIAVGDSTTDAHGFQRGFNYIYDNGIFHTPNKTFSTTDVLRRVELADYDQNGTLDLAAASYIDPAAPTDYNLCLLRLYDNTGPASFTANECLIGPLTKDSIWEPALAYRSQSLAWADVDGNGTLDLGVGDYGANRIHAGDGFNLGAASTAIDGTNTENTASLAWSDLDGDSDQDVAWGGDGQPARLYRNNGEDLPGTTWTLAWTGPSHHTHDVAWGQLGSDRVLALGNYGQANTLYKWNGSTLVSTSWSSNDSANTTALAWIDYNQDGKLDLTAANFDHRVVGYAGNGATLAPDPQLLTPNNAPIRDLAWANWDGDSDADLALANDSQPVQVYRNTGTFPMSLAWTAPLAENTQSVAWADVDGDGYPDLVVGNSGSANKLYQNDGGGMDSTPVWSAAQSFNTRDLTWGDVDNDGDLDLAVANDYERNTLYRNRRFFRIDSTTVKPLGRVNDLAWGDFNGDNYPDLAIGGYDLEAPGGGFIYLVKNNTGSLSFTKNAVIKVDHSGSTADLADLAWADYNRDGYQDLVGTFPGDQEIRFYQNLNGSGAWLTAISLNGPTAYALDWVDFQRDGWPDLALADSPGGNSTTRLKIYLNQADAGGSGNFVFNDLVQVNTSNLIVSSLRGIDRDNDGDLDLSAVDSQVQSQQYTTYGSFLNPRLGENVIDTSSFPASSVAWGDIDGDSRLDLLLGGSGQATRLYRNIGTGFCRAGSHPVTCPAGPTFDIGGRRVAILGDFDGDDRLDIADGVPGGQVKLYRSSSAPVQAINSVEAYALAWGDGDGDGLLDLLIGGKEGTPRQSYLYFNQRETPFLDSTASRWALPAPQATVSMAWADFDNDTHLDFVIGNCSTDLTNSVQLYRNNRDNTFSLVTGSGLPTTGYCTRSVAWADFDGDGDPDLALGNDGAPSFIYQNQGSFGGTFAPVWNSGATANTRSAAWGDWNNDGKPDLALGNYGQKTRVYANFSTTSSSIFVWLWESKIAPKVTGLAWGDKDGDGDLDLAFSQDGTDLNGIFENGYASPAHLGDRYAPLPQNPTYLKVERPTTAAAYDLSSPVLISKTIKIDYTVYDLLGDSIVTGPTRFEYSLNGGGSWQTATLSGTTTHDGSTQPNGQTASLLWNAAADGAIGDNVLFRISVVHNKPVGPVQQASSSAVSPPFRVRGITCEWPADPAISFKSTDSPVNSTYSFSAGISSGAGNLRFEWNFGDGGTALGQDKVLHIFETGRSYTVTLTVSGEPCPVTREVVVSSLITTGQTLVVPPGDEDLTYLPLLLKAEGTDLTSLAHSDSAAQVSGLQGRIEAGQTILTWEPAAGVVTAYRVYRSSRPGPAHFSPLAELPAGVTRYVDTGAACGYIYYVTAIDTAGESGASATSFASGPCH